MGFVQQEYWADLTIVDLDADTKVEKENLRYKCGWSPVETYTFNNKVVATIVNGQFVYKDGKIIENKAARQVSFNRLSH